MVCPECGRDLDPNACFCDRCRSPIAATGQTQPLRMPADQERSDDWLAYSFDGSEPIYYRRG